MNRKQGDDDNYMSFCLCKEFEFSECFGLTDVS